MGRGGVCALAVVVGCVCAAGASAQTTDAIRAPLVKSRVRVQWDATDGKLLVAIDDQPTFRPIGVAEVFLTPAGLVIAYPRLNPLRIHAVGVRADSGLAVSGSAAAGLRVVLGMATIVTPPRPALADRPATGTPPTGGSDCAALVAARADAENLMGGLFGTRNTPTVAALLASWRRTIDEAFAAGQSGPVAVAAALGSIDQLVRDLESRAADDERLTARVEAAMTAGPSADPCEASARAVYGTLRAADPRGRFVQLAALRAALTLLRQALFREYVEPGAAKWIGAEYLLSPEVRPAAGTPVRLAVRVSHFAFEVDGASGAPVGIEETAGSTAVVAQKFSRFATEFSVATVVSTVTPPHYGTTSNGSGQTVVASLGHERTSVSAALLGGFVCRCETGPFVAPMFQVGVTTNKDVPAILLGGGVRLFGLPKGDVALGAGWMMAWIKDLRSLEEGDVVGGTKDIEADMRSVRRHGLYLALQYKF